MYIYGRVNIPRTKSSYKLIKKNDRLPLEKREVRKMLHRK